MPSEDTHEQKDPLNPVSDSPGPSSATLLETIIPSDGKSISTSESHESTKAELDEERRLKRRITFTSDSEEDLKVKKSRRSEPHQESSSKSTPKFERRHFASRRSEPLQPQISFAKLVAGEYPIHEIPKKWHISFSTDDLNEVTPLELTSKRRQSQVIPDSSGTESSSDASPVQKKRLSFVGNFWRAKPPFPRPKFIIGKDGACYSLFFTNRYVFSNHFPADFVVNGRSFSCSEQYYMYQKAKYFCDDEIANLILQTSDPKEMKRLGRQVEHFDEEIWKKVSLQVMMIGCYNKFVQNKTLRFELFRTVDTTLVEASPLDQYWGVGLAMENDDIRDPKKWRGENLLGYLLTQLRDHLKKQCEYEEEIKQVYTEFDNSF